MSRRLRPVPRRFGALGFNFAELLITLGLIVLAGMFMVPTLTMSFATNSYRATLRTAVETLQSVAAQAAASGQLSTATVPYTLLQGQLEVIQACSNATSGGCWSASQGNTSVANNKGGFVFKNGLNLAGVETTALNAGSDVADLLVLDANGAAGPNTLGTDQLQVAICFNAAGCGAGGNAFSASYNNSLGELAVTSGSTAANTSLFESLFN